MESMRFDDVMAVLIYSASILIIVALLFPLANICWFLPRKINEILRKQGILGPPPRFMVGNLPQIKKIKEELLKKTPQNVGVRSIRHDIELLVFPHFAQWSRVYGKKFVYWMGTEPFIYVRDPDLIKRLSLSRSLDWGRPAVFREDKMSLFGNGLLMAEGEDWAHQRRIVAPAFYADKIKRMVGDMVASTLSMLDRWNDAVREGGGSADIDIDDDITKLTADIIARTSFGASYDKGKQVFTKLRSLQQVLYGSNHLLGVPGSRLINGGVRLKTNKLGKEIDDLLLLIVMERRKLESSGNFGSDLLGLILAENNADGVVENGKRKKLTTRQFMDECKTFFFAGHETTALSVMWSMMLLAMYPDWQQRLRAEVMEITQGRIPDAEMLTKMKIMDMVLSETMRLYPPAPYTHRQAKQNMQMGDIFVPKGTSIWFDILGLHHDSEIWDADVNEFKPERFEIGASNASKQTMAFIPFGFGSRMCIGQNLASFELKVIMSMVVSRFRFSLSERYCHCPISLPSLRPSHGLPLVFEYL